MGERVDEWRVGWGVIEEEVWLLWGTMLIKSLVVL